VRRLHRATPPLAVLMHQARWIERSLYPYDVATNEFVDPSVGLR
jgi:hypothetical protein